MPYVVSGLVAAGGPLALSTADGLLLTITSALSHDVITASSVLIVDPVPPGYRQIPVPGCCVLAATVRSRNREPSCRWSPGHSRLPPRHSFRRWCSASSGKATVPGALAGMAGVSLSLYYIPACRVRQHSLAGVSGSCMEPWFLRSRPLGRSRGGWFATIIVVSLF